MASETTDHVLATYREIAEHFELGSTRAARTKVKRAGWAHEPANHPYDALRIRVPRSAWDAPRHRPRDAKPDQALDADTDQPNDTHPDQTHDAKGIKNRDPGHKNRDAQGINGLDALVAPLREQLDRERGRADVSEARVQELTEQLIALREERATLITKAEAAESRVDDLMAQIRDLTKRSAEGQARAELLQVEVDRLRAEAERLRGQGLASAAPRRRRWWSWRRDSDRDRGPSSPETRD